MARIRSWTLERVDTAFRASGAVLKPWGIKSSATQRGPGEGWRLRKESKNGCSRIQSRGIAVRMLQM